MINHMTSEDLRRLVTKLVCAKQKSGKYVLSKALGDLAVNTLIDYAVQEAKYEAQDDQ